MHEDAGQHDPTPLGPSRRRRLVDALLEPQPPIRRSTALWFVIVAAAWFMLRDLHPGRPEIQPYWSHLRCTASSDGFDFGPFPDAASEHAEPWIVSVGWQVDVRGGVAVTTVETTRVSLDRPYLTGWVPPDEDKLRAFRRALAAHLRRHEAALPALGLPWAECRLIEALEADSAVARWIAWPRLAHAAATWLTGALMVLLLLIGAARRLNRGAIQRRLRRTEGRICPVCGYDLAASFPVCPECGRDYRAEVRRLGRMVQR